MNGRKRLILALFTAAIIVCFASCSDAKENRKAELRNQELEEFENFVDNNHDSLSEHFYEYFSEERIMFTGDDIGDAYWDGYEDGYNDGNYVAEEEQPQDYVDPDEVRLYNTPQSTCFSRIGHKGGCVVVEFRDSGSKYAYYDVPENVWDEFSSAESLGKYYNANIKGKYESERIYD